MRIAPHFNKLVAVLASAAALVYAMGCGPGEGSPTTGQATVYTSEDLYPVMELEVQAFQGQYSSATINLLTASTREAIAHLVNDSVKLVIVPRYLTPEEVAVITRNNIQIDSQRIAYDGIAVIANSYNAMSHISVQQLAALASGGETSLKRAGGRAAENAVLAFGGKNSDMKEQVAPRLLGAGHALAAPVAPCTSTTHAVQFVAEHPSAIGFIALDWTKNLPRTVTVLDVGDPAFKRLPYLDTLEFFAPHPAHIYRNYYPLRRTIYILSRGTHINVDKGFLAFVAGREGQSIITKNGLVPATQPVRLVP